MRKKPVSGAARPGTNRKGRDVTPRTDRAPRLGDTVPRRRPAPSVAAPVRGSRWRGSNDHLTNREEPAAGGPAEGILRKRPMSSLSYIPSRPPVDILAIERIKRSSTLSNLRGALRRLNGPLPVIRPVVPGSSRATCTNPRSFPNARDSQTRGPCAARPGSDSHRTAVIPMHRTCEETCENARRSS